MEKTAGFRQFSRWSILIGDIALKACSKTVAEPTSKNLKQLTPLAFPVPFRQLGSEANFEGVASPWATAPWARSDNWMKEAVRRWKCLSLNVAMFPSRVGTVCAGKYQKIPLNFRIHN